MKNHPTRLKLISLAMCTNALFACGGGGAAPVADQTPTVGCSGANCSAVSASQYSGTGLGVWKYHNTSSNDVSVAVDIAGVSAGKKVTLAYSNGASNDASSTPQLGTQVSTEVGPGTTYVAPMTNAVPSAESIRRAKHDANDLVHHQVQLKNQAIKIRLREQAAMQTQTFEAMPEAALASHSAPQFSPPLNATKNWVDYFDSTPTTYATSNKHVCTLPTGRNIVFWQHNSDTNITPAIMTRFTSAACGSTGGFARINNLIGDAWGSHGYNNLINDTTSAKQDINIVFAKAAASAGWAGYFYGGNNFVSTAADPSNQALVFFINTNGIASDVDFYISTLFHEATHMVVFYQNAVKQKKESQAWLDETFAMMTEDIVTPAVTGYNKIINYRIPNYLLSGANVSLNNWTELSSVHYYMGGAFGAYLNRQYGINLYKQLVTGCTTGTAKTNSYDCLDSLIIANGGTGIKDAFSQFGATVHARLPASNMPAGFGYGARLDSGYTLQAIDLSAMSLSAPAALSSYQSMTQTYLNETIAAGKTRYIRNSIVVPAGTHLQVIIQ
jgi:Peptidase M30